MKNIATKSLKHRLVAQFTIYVSIALMLVTILTSMQMAILVYEQVINEYKENGSYSFVRFDEHVGRLVDNVQQLANNPLIIKAMTAPDQQETYLPQLSANFAAGRDVSAFILVDYASKAVFTDRKNVPDYNSSQPLREALGMDQPAVMIDKELGMLVISHPITFYKTTQGALVVYFDLQQILKQTITTSKGSTQQVFAHNKLLMREKEHQDRDSSILTMYPDSTQKWITNLGISLVINIDKSSLFSPVYEAIIDTLLLSLVILMGTILLAFRIGGRIANPVATLRDRIYASKRETGLNLTPVGTGDELEDLASAFEERTQELWSIQEDLEIRVVERTQELTKTNQTLEQEIIERSKAEELALHNHELMNQAQAIAHMGSWEWDIFNDTLLWSDEIYHIFGLDVGSIQPSYKTFMEHVHPDDRQLVTESVEDALEFETDSYIVEHRIVRKNGDISYVQETGQVYRDQKGTPSRMLGTVHDTTQRKLFELELSQARTEAEKASQTKSVFLANMSHEIRTPMNAILGLTHLCMKTKLNEQQNDYLEKVSISANGLLSLINDIFGLFQNRGW